MSEITLEEIQKRGEEALAVLNKYTDVEVPKNLEDAIHGNWVSIVQRTGQDVLGHIPAKDMERLSRRVITIERANEILRTFEDSMVAAYVKTPTNPLRRVVDGVLRLPRFVLTHLAALYEVILPVIVAWLGTEFNLYAAHVKLEGIQFEKRRGIPDDQFESRYSEEIRLNAQIQKGMDALAEITKGVVAVLGFYMVEELLALAASVEVLKKQMLPVTVSRDAGCVLAENLALPQRRRVAVRRRKRAR